MSWLIDNSEAEAINNDWAAARTRPAAPEKTGLLKSAGMGFMKGGVDLARGTALAASTLFPSEDAPDDGTRIIPRKEDFFKFIDTRLADAEKYWTPDPESVGMAGQIIGAISGLPLQLAGGPGLMAVSSGLNTGTKLSEQGVNDTTATVAGIGAGVVNALMMKLPASGVGLKQTAGLVALNPLMGAGQDYALKQGLESQGYDKQAAEIDPLNPVSRIVDLTMGGVFGAMGYHANRVTARAEATAFEHVADRAEDYFKLIKEAGGEKAIREQLPVETVDSLDTVRSYLKTLETNPFNSDAIAGVDRHLAALKTALGDVTEGRPVDVSAHIETVLQPDYKPLELQGLMDKWSARYGMTPDEEAGISSLIQARAKVMGMEADEFVTKHFADVTNEQPAAGALMQDKPLAQPFYSKLLKEVDALPQEKWNASDLMNKIRKTEGVKADEIAWTGLDEFLKGKGSVTRAEVREYLDQNQVRVEEVTKGGNSKYSAYVTPGGENYRELLLTLPEKRIALERSSYMGEGATVSSPDTYRSGHFDEPNILAHIRFNERAGANGEAILHVEEVQSDWHQAGRDKGYISKYTKDEITLNQELSDQVSNGLFWIFNTPESEGAWQIPRSKYSTPEAARDYIVQVKDKTPGVPNAPFAKTWHELALRRMLRYAAENGFDRLTWTTGEQQAARYDISKKMESVSYRKDGEQFIVSGVDLHGGEHALGTFTEKQLPDAVGKELSQKITAGEGVADGQFTKLAGLDLKVGGAGMKGFYDKMLPQFLDKLGRKFGAKVEDVKVDTLDYERPGYTRNVSDHYDRLENPDHGMTTVHSLPITEAMKNSLLYEGQPLFQGGKGAVSFLADGRAVIHALENPDFSTASHELAHVFAKTLTHAEKFEFDKWLFGYNRVRGGEWSTIEHESFARAWEAYLAEGKAPSPELQGAFDKFKTWLVDIYRNIINSPLERKLHENTKKAFDALLVSESLRKDVAPEVQAVRDAGIEHAAELEADLHGLAGMDIADPFADTGKPITAPVAERVTPARILRDIAMHTYEDPELIKRFVADPTKVAGALAQALEAEAGQLKGAKSNTAGQSLVEFLRDKGIKDDAGDLLAMDIDKNKKPGVKNMLRPDGMALDKVRGSLVEQGYLPEGATVEDLLDAVGGELRGNPVYAQSGEVSTAPEWFQSILNLNRRSGGKDAVTAEQAAEALRKTAAGKFNSLKVKDQDMVLAALDSINHQIQSTAHEFDAQELQVGDRFMSTDLALRTVVAERNGQLIMNDGSTVAVDSVMNLLGEVDRTGRPPEKGYDALDYQVESLLTERGDFQISNGKDAAGNEISVSAREYIDEVKNTLAAAENRKHLYDRAAACMGLEF